MVTLTEEQKAEFHDILTNSKAESNISIVGLIPRIIRIPGSSGDVSDMCDDGKYCVPITFVLTYYKGGVNGSFGTGNFWEVQQVPEIPGQSYEGTDMKGNYIFNGTLPRIVLLNTPVSPASSLIGSLAALGIIGICK